MKTCLLICLTGCLLAVQSLRADTLPACTDCDTIVTTYGKVIPAEIIEKSYSTIRFYECGDTTRALNVMPMSQVRKIRKACKAPEWVLPPGAELPDFLKKAERKANRLVAFGGTSAFFGWILVVSSLSIFFSLTLLILGLLVLGVSVIVGGTLLVKAKQHPYLHHFRLQGHLILWFSFLPFALIILLFVLLYTGGISFVG